MLSYGLDGLLYLIMIKCITWFKRRKGSATGRIAGNTTPLFHGLIYLILDHGFVLKITL